MKHSPYYDMSDCCQDDRANQNVEYGNFTGAPGIPMVTPSGMPAQMPTGAPSGPGGPIPGMMPGMMPEGTMQPTFQQPQGQPSAGGQFAPIPPSGQPQAMTLQSLDYLNGFLRTQIGKRVRVEFLIGTGTLIDKSGTLLGVGANYIVLRQAMTDDILTCDFFTIKFITFYY